MKSIIAKAFAVCLIAAMPKTLLAAPSETEAVGAAMSAEAVYLMYLTNSLQMEKYEKKRRQVHGKVINIGRTWDGFPCLLLYGGEDALFGVKCAFPKQDASRLSNLALTTHVIVEGVLQGMTGDVIFTDCALLKVF